MAVPQLISLQKISFDSLDFDIKVVEENIHTPFSIKRVYWLSAGNEEQERGNHAHLNSQQLIVALSGSIKIQLMDTDKKKYDFLLSSQEEGLYIPSKHWLTILLPAGGVLLCFSSLNFAEQSTLYDFKDFEKLV